VGDAFTFEHQEDDRALSRFIDWVEDQTDDCISVLFTPWGEALIRKRYQRALVRLTNMPHVQKAAIQTNLSGNLNWVEECDKSRWAFGPRFTRGRCQRVRFEAKCRELERRGVRFSVGVVGQKEHAAEIEALRRELSPAIYLWINAYKRSAHYYNPPDVERFEAPYYNAADVERFEAIDPLFPINNQNHPSLGQKCRGGESVISVSGDGTMRRCHFIRQPIGNIYEADFKKELRERLCSNATCGCHIGYVHMDHLRLYSIYGNGVLERIPVNGVAKSSAGN
jgi:MoaA/NifB/PqqE/SkfB family radical SAM enzyme